MPEKSELQKLLEKNAYGEGLTNEEYLRAWELISNPKFSEKLCWVCKMNNEEESAIFNTGLCRVHARYALASRK